MSKWALLFFLTLSSINSHGQEPVDEILPIAFEKPKDQLELPLFELGVVTVSAWAPDYPGASEGRLVVIPAPAFLYRGDFFKADDRGGIRGSFFDNEDMEISVSFGGNLPSSSGENKAREGMSSLGLILQIGPRFRYYLLQDKKRELYFDLPLRPGVAIGSSWRAWRGTGFMTSPEVGYEHRWSRYRGFVSVSVNIASYELHKYFYNVNSSEATPERSEFHPRSGYFSTSLFTGLSIDWTPKLRTFLGGQIMSFSGNVNKKSPLLKEQTNFTAAFGLVYMMYESKRKVMVNKRRY